MIELERHIEILLLSNDCVIIPGFGGFMAYYTNAKYDERDYTFLPPTRAIGFNPQLKINDSLLAQSYVETYDISYPEAVRRIEQETEELKQIIGNDGCYEFNDLGVLSLNDNGHYIFEPCEAGLLTPSLYGLGSFNMKFLSEDNTCNSDKDSEDEITPSAIEKNIIEDNSEDVVAESYTISKVLVRNIAAACIAVLVFLLLPSTLGNGEISKISTSKIDTGMLTRIMPKDVTTNTDVQLAVAIKHINDKKDIAKQQIPTNHNVTTSIKNTDNSRIYYSIVLASKVSRKNADSYVNKLKQRGLDMAKVITQNSTKVVYGEYHSESAARNALNRLNNKEEFKDSWILKIKD